VKQVKVIKVIETDDEYWSLDGKLLAIKNEDLDSNRSKQIKAYNEMDEFLRNWSGGKVIEDMCLEVEKARVNLKALSPQGY
jgi:hypothetical protein